MFRLHETTRRRSCRTAFVLVCLAPLVAIGGLGAFQRMPVETALHQRQLGEQLGLRARIARVEHPRPGVTRYVGLELVDPETGQVVLRATQVELALPVGPPTAGHFARGQIVLVEPQIETEGADSFRQLLLRALRRRADQRDMEWHVTAETVEINTVSSPLSLIDASAVISSGAMGSEATISFLPAGNFNTPRETNQRVEMRFVRNWTKESPHTGFELSTHGAELQCDPFLRLGGIESRLGEQCRFRGPEYAPITVEKRDLVVIWDDSGWKATIRGDFLNADLRRFAGRRISHMLEGRATLHVTLAEFQRGRLVEAKCSLDAGPGGISPSLVTAAIGELGLRGPKPPAGATDPIAFDQLAAGFTLDSLGLLTITGDCGGRASGLVLSGSSGQGSLLLAEPVDQPQSVIGLVRMLSPSGDNLVQASQQAAALLQWLPLPADTVEPKSVARRPENGDRRH